MATSGARSLLYAQDPASAGGASAPLRLVVPFTAGTGIDLVARSIGPRLGERLGRAVVVDNRPGASGNIGTEAVVRAAPNGNTLLVTVNTLVMNRSLYPQLPFDPLKDLVPVSQTSWGHLVLVASKQSGLRSAADLLAAARAGPGRLNYASPGVGTPHHLAMELLKTTDRVSITHIPYRGTAPALADLLGGQVDAMFLPVHVALVHLRAGKLQALGIGADRRHPLLPDVPTLREAGTGDVNVTMWYGIFAPPRTPPGLVASLNHELQGILAMPDLRAAFQTQGMDPMGSTPEGFGRMVAEDAERWARVVRTQNIKPD
ncbi:tripartite tricarboxylate transporter substrate binding protein [Sphingomonas sp. NCPPB 2930]